MIIHIHNKGGKKYKNIICSQITLKKKKKVIECYMCTKKYFIRSIKRLLLASESYDIRAVSSLLHLLGQIHIDRSYTCI
jgi:hypothetical protein